MRILLIGHFPLTGSGSGVYTTNIAHSLVKLGHEVCLLFPENQPVDPIEGFKLHPVFFNGCTPDALPFNFPCFTTHPRSMQTFYDLTDDELAAYENAFKQAIAQEVEEFKPDVIHSGHLWLLSSYAADFGVPLVVTVHGTDLIGYQKDHGRFHDHARHAIEAAHGIITISADNDNLVKELFPDQASKSHLILNGYNPDVFYPDPVEPSQETRDTVLAKLGLPTGYAHIVSFAGKFAHFKGIDILLRGAAKFQRDDTALVLAGDGELFDSMNELAAELGLRNVFFVHNQPHSMLRILYSTADVSLLTSRREPFGLVMIEAMACGAPVIGSDDGGAVDIIEPGTGLLFRSEDPDSLAAQVTRVLAGEETFDRTVIAASAKSRFSQDEAIKHSIAVYESALAAQADAQADAQAVPSVPQETEA